MVFTMLHGVLFQVCYMEFDRKDIPMNKMVVTSLESKFNVFDLRTQHPTKGFASLTEKVNTTPNEISPWVCQRSQCIKFCFVPCRSPRRPPSGVCAIFHKTEIYL